MVKRRKNNREKSKNGREKREKEKHEKWQKVALSSGTDRWSPLNIHQIASEGCF